MSVIEFNPFHRFVRPVGELIWQVSQVLVEGQALKQSIETFGRRHAMTARLKTDIGISSVVLEWQYASAIERVQTAVSKLEKWKSKARDNEVSGALPLLIESLHLLSEGEEDLRASTQRQ